jgi:hypothetical protein
LLCYGIQQLRLGRLIEIDQHIATEYHVELPQRPEIAQQIPLAVLHHTANRLADPPAVFLLAKVAHQHLHRQAALHLELRVHSVARALHLIAGQVGADDLDPPVTDSGTALGDDHRDRIRLLSGRRCGGPHA